MSDVTTRHQEIEEVSGVDTPEVEGTDLPAELHLASADGDIDVVRTTQKVRWLMQRC